MKTRVFGKLNKYIFPIGFGGAAISGEGKGYGFGPMTENESIDLLHYAFDQGINLYDTAPVYGFGTSEIRLGKAFKNKRDQIFVISKGGVCWDMNKRVDISNDPKVISSMLDESLKRLQVDYIDHYMIHWPDPRIDIRKAIEVLSRAKEKGKINSIGLSNTNQEEYIKAKEVDRIEGIQSELNIFNQKFIKDFFNTLHEDKVGYTCWGTFDKGIITRTVKNEQKRFSPMDARSWAPWWKKGKKLRQKKFEAMKNINNLLDDKDISLLEFALGSNLIHEEVTSTLCGMRNRSQIDSIIKAVDNLPSKEVIEEINLLIDKYDIN